MSDPVKLVTSKTDVERAAELRALATPLLQQLCTIMDDARRDGLTLNFGIGADSFGRHTVNALTVVKPL